MIWKDNFIHIFDFSTVIIAYWRHIYSEEVNWCYVSKSMKWRKSCVRYRRMCVFVDIPCIYQNNKNLFLAKCYTEVNTHTFKMRYKLAYSYLLTLSLSLLLSLSRWFVIIEFICCVSENRNNANTTIDGMVVCVTVWVNITPIFFFELNSEFYWVCVVSCVYWMNECLKKQSQFTLGLFVFVVCPKAN